MPQPRPDPFAAPAPLVHVVDDDARVRTALERLLVAHGFLVQCHASAEAFLHEARESRLSCVLLDVRMPGTTGLALQQRLSAEQTGQPVIFLSGQADVSDGVRAMKAGAVDFLQKPVDEQELLRAVDRGLAACEAWRRRRARAQDVAARLERLTPREHDVMRLVVLGLRNREIAGRLGIAEPTVKIHRGRMMRKMEVETLPDLVRMADVAPRPEGSGASRPGRGEARGA